MKKFIMMLLVVVVAGAACAPKKNANRGRVGRWNGGNPSINPGGNTLPPPTQDQSYGTVQFNESAVVDFLSASLDPQTDMELPITRVRFAGKIELDGYNNILNLGGHTASITTNSILGIAITDQIAARHEDEDIVVGFQNGYNGFQVSGQVYNGGQVDVTFSDDYGCVRLNGQFNSQYFNGTLSYANGTRNCSAGQSLGQAQISTCALFRCQ